MLRLAFLSVLLAAGLWWAGRPTTGHAQEVPTCLGEPVTIFSDQSGAVLQGTGGRDVFFTDKVQTIHALGGDDLICIDGNRATVYAGSGNDRIDAVFAAAIYGESGNDHISTFGGLVVSGGSGNDNLNSFATDAVQGDGGSDTFSMFSVERCDGGSGDDIARVLDCETATNIP
jgi:hypothetical protein